MSVLSEGLPRSDAWRITNGRGSILNLTRDVTSRREALAKADAQEIADARIGQRNYRWWIVIPPGTFLRYHRYWRVRWIESDATHSVDFLDWKNAILFYASTRLTRAGARMIRVIGKSPKHV